MGEQADAVRTGRPLDAWLSGDERFHDVRLSEHGCGEDGRMRPVCQQKLGYRPIPHMGCCAQRALPIAEAPVPGSFCQ